jgi:hypothetical protein
MGQEPLWGRDRKCGLRSPEKFEEKLGMQAIEKACGFKQLARKHRKGIHRTLVPCVKGSLPKNPVVCLSATA